MKKKIYYYFIVSSQPSVSLVPHPWIHPTQDPVVLYYIFIGGKKKIHVSEPEQFKPMMSNGQLYFAILFI